MEKLSRATGGKIVASVKDLAADALGKAKKVEEVKIGESKLLYIRDCKNPKAVTVVIRGGSDHVIDEAERTSTMHSASSATLSKTAKSSRAAVHLKLNSPRTCAPTP
jgi:chaperonin GroEL (HSP60 family)